MHPRISFKRSLFFMLGMVLAISLAGCSGTNGSGGDEITVGRAQWNYDVITAEVLYRALEDHGYQPEFKDLYDMGIMFTAVNEGTVDIYADAWLPDTHRSYVEPAKNLVTGGNIWGAECPYVWTVPTYVVEEYGITSITDLKGNADIFDGKIMGIEEGTGGTEMSREALDVYGLDGFEYVTSSVAAMIAEVKSAALNERPIVAIMWRPHPIFDQIELTMLEDPEEVFAFDTVQYAVNETFAAEQPEIIAFLENFEIPRSDIEAMMARNENEDISAEKLGEEWYTEHKAEIESWWE